MKYKAFALILTLSAPLAAQTPLVVGKLAPVGHVNVEHELEAGPLVRVSARCEGPVDPEEPRACGGLYAEAVGEIAGAPLLIGLSGNAYPRQDTVEARGTSAAAWPIGAHVQEAVGLRAWTGTSRGGSIDTGIGIAVAPTPEDAHIDTAIGVLVEDQTGSSAEWGIIVLGDDPTYLGGAVSLGTVPDGGAVPLCLDSGNRIARCDGDLAALLAEVRALRAEVAALKGGAR